MKNGKRRIALTSLFFAMIFTCAIINEARAHYLAPEALENARLATVAILDPSADTKTPSLSFRFNVKGTGTHLWDGYILTARHVTFFSQEVGVLPKITVLTADRYELEANLVNENEFTDIALYRLAEEDRGKIRGKAVFAQTEPQLGDDVFTLGFPLNWGLTYTFGHLGNPNTYLSSTLPSRLLQMDLPVCSGNSGSGVFNEKGELGGMLHAIIQTENVQGLGGCSRFAFAVPAKLLENVAQTFILRKQPEFPLLGIEMDAIKHNKRWMVGVKSAKGAALAGGLLTGDILIAVNGTAILDAAFFKSLLIETIKPGDILSFLVLRNGKEMVIKVRAGGQ